MFLRKPVNTSVLGYWTSFLENGQNGPLISRAVKDTLAIRDGCRLACGLCAPTGFVESNEYSNAVTGSHVNSIVGGEFSRL